RTLLETKQGAAQLNPVAIVKQALAGNRLVVNPRAFRRAFVIEENEVRALALNDGMMLLEPHVPEQSDVRPCVTTQKGIGLEQRVFATFLPAAQHPHRGWLKDALHQRR